MKLTAIDCDDACIHVAFDNGKHALYPHIWLRDNDPSALHPDTKERTFDLTTVSVGIRPQEQRFTPDALSLSWPDQSHESVYDVDWLYRHRPGVRRFDAAAVDQHTWTAADMPGLPRFAAAKCRHDVEVLERMLTTLKRLGIVLIEQLEDRADAGERFGDLIGFKRRTNYGVMFEVVNKPDPNNLAYTALPLPLHTDLPNQECIPGAQFLHCIANSATGGDSVFADGFQVCHDLEREEPDVFDTLKRVDLPWRFHDRNCDIVARWPIIRQHENGQFEAIAFNAHIADVPDLKADELPEFYRAYQNIMRRIRSDRYRIEYRLKPGEMVIMANRRVLHGRTGFDPQSGYRHLRGYYIDMNEIDNRLRVIHRNTHSVSIA